MASLARCEALAVLEVQQNPDICSTVGSYHVYYRMRESTELKFGGKNQRFLCGKDGNNEDCILATSIFLSNFSFSPILSLSFSDSFSFFPSLSLSEA